MCQFGYERMDTNFIANASPLHCVVNIAIMSIFQKINCY